MAEGSLVLTEAFLIALPARKFLFLKAAHQRHREAGAHGSGRHQTLLASTETKGSNSSQQWWRTGTRPSLPSVNHVVSTATPIGRSLDAGGRKGEAVWAPSDPRLGCTTPRPFHKRRAGATCAHTQRAEGAGRTEDGRRREAT